MKEIKEGIMFLKKLCILSLAFLCFSNAIFASETETLFQEYIGRLNRILDLALSKIVQISDNIPTPDPQTRKWAEEEDSRIFRLMTGDKNLSKEKIDLVKNQCDLLNQNVQYRQVKLKNELDSAKTKASEARSQEVIATKLSISLELAKQLFDLQEHYNFVESHMKINSSGNGGLELITGEIISATQSILAISHVTPPN